jgi:hypothetical protein
MKVFIDYDESSHPPILKMVIHGALHYRMDKHSLQKYREHINDVALSKGMLIPIYGPIDLEVGFIDPTSPDIANVLIALYRVLDLKSLSGPAVLADDGLIQAVKAYKFYPHGRSKYDNRIP